MKDLSREDILNIYINACKEYKRIVHLGELEQKYMLSRHMIIKNFGSLESLQKETGFSNKEPGVEYLTIIKEKMKKARLEKGRRLENNELTSYNIPNQDTLYSIFKSNKLNDIWKMIEKELPHSIQDYLQI